MAPAPSRVVQFDAYGEPAEVLRENRIDVADPPAGRVRIAVAAVGLNPADWELCRGFMPASLPRGIGYDVAGTVDAVGPGVSNVAEGDTVFGTADFAGQPSAGVADFAIVDGWWPVPHGLDPVAAAVLPMAAQTAVWTLDAMRLRPGQTLLVNGAGGMVGFAAVQIALRRDIHVVAVAGPTFAPALARFGAVTTSYGDGLAHRVRDLVGPTVAAVFDAAPPTPGTLRDLIAVTARAGDVMTIANHDEARRLGARVNLDHLAEAAPASSFLPEYAALAAQGDFVIPIAQALPFDRWRTAVRASTSGHPHGKVVLLPNG